MLYFANLIEYLDIPIDLTGQNIQISRFMPAGINLLMKLKKNIKM
jgi:hypothetical protein